VIGNVSAFKEKLNNIYDASGRNLRYTISLKQLLSQSNLDLQMFQRSDLENIDFDDGMLPYYRGLYSTVYEQYAFTSPGSEECIVLYRAPKLEGDNGLRFWLAAELEDDWNGRMQYFRPYIEDSNFKEISESEFNSIVHLKCKYLITKPDIPLISSSKFIGALEMHATEDIKDIDHVELFAEYENEYIYFTWETTA